MRNNRGVLPLCALILLLTGTRETARAQGPDVFRLTETLFVFERRDLGRDHDGDALKDDLEHQLAENFKPYFVFDSDEGYTRPNEPVTLFQVRPVGCIGFACLGVDGAPPYHVLISYAFLWRRDGGYGPSSDCGDAHYGDTGSAVLKLSSDDGKAWTLTNVDQNGWRWPPGRTTRWPHPTVQWYMRNHVMIFFSAHKHHAYFDISRDEDDSIFSEWGCNDDVNGRGRQVLPVLTSPLADHRPNNVGEPESHSSSYFIDALSSWGYRGEYAWSGRPFCGGLGCEDNTALTAYWITRSFHFTGSFAWDFFESLGGVNGRITSTRGEPIHGVQLYYKRVSGRRGSDGRPMLVGAEIESFSPGSWDTLPVDADGNYESRITLGFYVLRPVASDYNFSDVPILVEAGRGVYTTTNISAVADSRFAGSPVGRPSPILRDPASRIVAPGTSPSGGEHSAAYLKKLAIAENYVLGTSGLPLSIVMSDADAAGSDDPITGLPRQATISFHVQSVLDSRRRAANTFDDADCSTLHDTCSVGGPVGGAKIQVALLSGRDLVEPQSTDPVELTTNDRGNAYVLLRSGSHPGELGLEIKMTYNPVNPWAVFELAPHSIEIQPAVHGNDVQDQPRANLSLLLGTEDPTLLTAITAGRKSPAGVSRVPGDVNLDRVVDQKDIDVIHKMMNRKFGEKAYKLYADLNEDAVVDAKDEAMVLQHMKSGGMKESTKPSDKKDEKIVVAPALVMLPRLLTAADLIGPATVSGGKIQLVSLASAKSPEAKSLEWSGISSGDELTVRFDMPAQLSLSLYASFLHGPQSGSLRVLVNGKQIGEQMELTSKSEITSKLRVGQVELRPGTNTVTLVVTSPEKGSPARISLLALSLEK